MIATWKLPTSKVYHGLNNALGICVHKKHYQVLPTQMVPISALAHGLVQVYVKGIWSHPQADKHQALCASVLEPVKFRKNTAEQFPDNTLQYILNGGKVCFINTTIHIIPHSKYLGLRSTLKQ